MTASNVLRKCNGNSLCMFKNLKTPVDEEELHASFSLFPWYHVESKHFTALWNQTCIGVRTYVTVCAALFHRYRRESRSNVTLGIVHESYESSANRVILSHKYQKVAFKYRRLKSYHLGISSVNGILSQNYIFPVNSTTHTHTRLNTTGNTEYQNCSRLAFFFFFF